MLVKRNILLFFRDKASVFFSLIAVFLIIGLYALFLGGVMEEALRSALGFHSDMIGAVMAAMTLSGMIALTSVTGCMGAMGIAVADKANAANDFLTSPAPRGKITMGYITGSSVVGLVMTTTALLLCLVYIVLSGGSAPGMADFARLLLTVALSVSCANAMVYFLTLFIKTQNAFAAVSTVIGTLIGFLMGIYMPIGIMPNAVQWVIKIFPMSHAASMFKQILLDGDLAQLFAGAPADALDGFRVTYGVIFSFGDNVSGFWFSAAVLAATTLVFYFLSLCVMRTRRG